MLERIPSRVPYAELHVHSAYSFLDGASMPKRLIEEAIRLDLEAIAITDHDGMYGAVRFAEAAADAATKWGHSVKTVFGAELSLGLPGRQNGVADPDGSHLLLLARREEGYRRLCYAISAGQLAGGQKGRPVYDLDTVADTVGGDCLVLTGCRKGAVRRALATGGRPAAKLALTELVERFGRDNVAVELTVHGQPDDDDRNDVLAELAAQSGIPTVATGNVHYASPDERRLAEALAAVRARRSLDEMDGWLPAVPTAHVRSGDEMAAMFARYPGAVERAAEYGRECEFNLRLVAPDLPPRRVPKGYTEASYLRELTYWGAARRFRGKKHERLAYEMIEHELGVIEELKFPGYFLIVHNIVEFCRLNGILCQGRGSAANSAVCFALGITAVDAAGHEGAMFERFLSRARDEYPDIDLDIDSARREEVIQYVYDTYGRQNSAQVANVISYRPRNAVRDMAKALGYSAGQQDAWSKQIDHWGKVSDADSDVGIPARVVELADQVLEFPRHLGIHSGGMVLCSRPVSEVVPVEWATMPNRSVVQWDKDDCAWAGLVKFDLLGLGMLTALRNAIDLIRDHHDVLVDIADLDEKDPKVYDMLCRADAIGVFQVESRAQLGTLPRLKPRKFYDLVVEVALIRPGPIQGGSVHPYLRRRAGVEEVTYPHDKLETTLRRTLGIPLFQEQLMQMAVDIADFTPAEADQLRRAMGSKRSQERIEELRERFYAGMAANGLIGEEADRMYEKLKAFADFGFPESHAFSFAKLVYSSAYLKLYFPAAFCAALLNAQPMGFYSPQSLIADVRRHGVQVRRPDVNVSASKAKLEPERPGEYGESGIGERQAIRLGLTSVRTIGTALGDRIVAERDANGRYADMRDFARRVGLTVAQAEALATAGAFECFGLERREALWAAGAIAQERPDRLAGTAVGVTAPTLPGMSEVETTMADVWATGVSVDRHPVRHLRPQLRERGVLTAADLAGVEHGRVVRIGGAVTHRQRPGTAGGVTFLNVEDETGMVNVVCSPGLWTRYRRIARTSQAMIVLGKVERTERAPEVINVLAYRLEQLPLRVTIPSRDFR